MEKDFFARILICLVSLSICGAGRARADVDVKSKISSGTYTTVGVINADTERQVYIGGGGGNWGSGEENQPFSRTAVWLRQDLTFDEALLVSVGVGALFWYPLPNEPGKFWNQSVRANPAVHVASGTYHFGGMEKPWLRLKMGYFPYKYNPDARNLGEYLFRSGTYPGTVFTGGWSILNSAGYGASGLLGSMSFLDNHLKVDVGVFMDRSLEPNFDLSPSIVASYDFGGILELGAGIQFSHLIPFVPEVTTPENRPNAYYTDPTTGKETPLPLSEQNKPGLNDNPTADPSTSSVRPVADPLVGKNLPAIGDTLFGPTPAGLEGMGTALVDTEGIVWTQDHPSIPAQKEKGLTGKYYSVTENGVPDSRLSYYTFQGQKVMARAAIRPQKLLQSGLLGPDDLTLYGEIALLGIKDYPFYYEKKSERMPVMFGFNLPTFKFLDVLNVEFEYLKNPFLNSTYAVNQLSIPIWSTGDPVMPVADAQDWQALNAGQGDPKRVAKFRDLHDDPDWWWSMYAKKTIVPGFRVHLQVARDHFRPIGSTLAPSFEPVFHRKGLFKDYYWALRLEFGG